MPLKTNFPSHNLSGLAEHLMLIDYTAGNVEPIEGILRGEI